jgi:hypothetical protein
MADWVFTAGALVIVATLVLAAAGAAAGFVWPLVIVIVALVIVAAVALIRSYPVIATFALLALTVSFLALLLLRNTLASDCGLCDDAASSVSNAPRP